LHQQKKRLWQRPLDENQEENQYERKSYCAEAVEQALEAKKMLSLKDTVRRKIEMDEPDLIHLTINTRDFIANDRKQCRYQPDGSDWGVDGKSIGTYTHLKEFTFVDRRGRFAIEDLETFFRDECESFHPKNIAAWWHPW